MKEYVIINILTQRTYIYTCTKIVSHIYWQRTFAYTQGVSNGCLTLDEPFARCEQNLCRSVDVACAPTHVADRYKTNQLSIKIKVV